MFNSIRRVAFLIPGLLISGVTFAAPIVIGPGSQPPLYVTQYNDCYVLDDTEIIGPSETGPPEDNVWGGFAITLNYAGHITIDGGYFRGGDASYTGTNGDFPVVRGGYSLSLEESSGEIHGGTFIGGEANLSTYRGVARGGRGLALSYSDMTIYDGYFEGGISTKAGRPGSDPVIEQGHAINLFEDSELIMHGGQVNGDIFLCKATRLSIFGTDLEYDGSTVSGIYADGSLFSHSLRLDGGFTVQQHEDHIRFESIFAPEPNVIILFVTGALVLLSGGRKRGGILR